MGFLEKWKPSQELDRFRNEFTDLLEKFGFERDWLSSPLEHEFFSGSHRPAIESYVKDGKFIVRTDLPGVEPKNVDIKVVRNVLTIKGSREEKEETKKADFLRREVRYGSFERAITLPEGIKADDLKANYHDGVLEITAPLPKEAAPKEVKIEVEAPKGSSQKKTAA